MKRYRIPALILACAIAMFWLSSPQTSRTPPQRGHLRVWLVDPVTGIKTEIT